MACHIPSTILPKTLIKNWSKTQEEVHEANRRMMESGWGLFGSYHSYLGPCRNCKQNDLALINEHCKYCNELAGVSNHISSYHAAVVRSWTIIPATFLMGIISAVYAFVTIFFG